MGIIDWNGTFKKFKTRFYTWKKSNNDDLTKPLNAATQQEKFKTKKNKDRFANVINSRTTIEISFGGHLRRIASKCYFKKTNWNLTVDVPKSVRFTFYK